jgi:hypothetical protein
VAERVSEFHKNLSEKDFLDLQKTNRKLWEEHLTLDKFYHIFINNTVLIL